MWQIKKMGQPVKVELISPDNGEIEITNRFLFANLKELDGVWELKADDEVVEKGILTADIRPQAMELLKIPYHKPEIKEGTEYRLLLSFRLREKEVWADAGFEIAWEEFDMPWFKPLTQKSDVEINPINVMETDEQLIVSGDGFRYSFSKENGCIVSLNVGNKELVKNGAQLNLWRAPLANETDEWTFRSSNIKHRTDGYGRFAATEWYSAGLDKMNYILESFKWAKDNYGRALVNSKSIYTLGTGRGAFLSNIKYIINGRGEITIEHSVVPNGQMPSWLPRIGQEWIFDRSLGWIEWYGLGPQENYPDRKTGYRTGIYTMTVDEMYEPYLIPQDYGLRTDNRWVRITDKDGTGLEFMGDRLFNFNAYPFSTENLTKALYTYQLHDFDGITFNLDYATSGVGCTATGVFPEYQVMPQRYDFILKLRPILPPTP
jgi:beta-galactosidase